MSFVVFKGERKLAELVLRAYGELKASDRKRAEAALVRANPHLAKLKDVAPGSLIVLPLVPGIGEPRQRRSEVPAADAIGEVAAALEDYGKRLDEALDAEGSELGELRALLKSRPLREKVREVEEAGAYVERVAAALKDREAEHEQRRAFLRQLPAARKELAELAELLG